MVRNYDSGMTVVAFSKEGRASGCEQGHLTKYFRNQLEHRVGWNS